MTLRSISDVVGAWVSVIIGAIFVVCVLIFAAASCEIRRFAPAQPPPARADSNYVREVRFASPQEHRESRAVRLSRKKNSSMTS